MALRDLSDPRAVVAALDEFDEIGRVPFLKKNGFGKAERDPCRNRPLGSELGRCPDDLRVKTLRPGSELERVRAAISQPLEYRFFFGAPEDGLCLVSDHPLSDKRVRLRRALGIPVLLVEGDHMLAGSPDARERSPSLLDAEPRG
jgi:hypothetical protein